MRILGIETSCDETGVGIVEDGRLLTNLLATQVDLHERFGGVVPELASRAHVEALTPLLDRALDEAGSRFADLDGVAEAYSVTGQWDFVAIVRVPNHEDLAPAITGRLARLPGVARTYTMVAFEAFSQHDLEAMFSIGA